MIGGNKSDDRWKDTGIALGNLLAMQSKIAKAWDIL